MKVILKQDVTNLGYANEIVKVKNGYARNYLIPKGIAIMLTPSSEKEHAELMKQRTFKEEKIRKESETLAKALENIVVKVGAKAGTSGKIFGSVNAIQLADAIKQQFNYEIDRKKIVVDGESVKELGTYSAKINIYKDIKVDIKFEVIAE
ncbi:MAG TPA: 50S ribosomal protein L9 [Bacteroidales bacterium]|jgi:large subunit ribosomal protein L9|nr:50S ribosomal protein L9 [Bacteroidales bacterium]HNZ43652.1 50S ribosomal protein L9 [Bacteroidales bacterium]HOH84340.1 50S ribosomal protein L9 [Bacteroidales bacterium]HPB25742.1 50S ribosomal protein L9 [Bacteroidales bacterium]HPI30716.1 50S ribosomal protein L9 [Bacteroidales bacterium]